MNSSMKKWLIAGLGLVFGLIAFSALNPFSINDGGSRTVVQTYQGDQFVQFTPGVFYAGFFSKETEWPNQISVTYGAEKERLELQDNSIEVGPVQVMFSDGTIANVQGIVQFVLPTDSKDMIGLHNNHRTPESLVSKRLATYVKEALTSSAQEMTSDKHYGGGRAQMSTDFQEQLRNGIYISRVVEKIIYDSIEKENKRVYLSEIQIDSKGQKLHKASSIAEYNISVSNASITATHYEQKVLDKLSKIIDASTKSAVSRQELMTAQQQALTAEAEGKKNLVQIEYEQKQEQTKQVVAAQTEVEVAKQAKLQQIAAYEAAIYEAKKRQTLADVAAYEKRTTVQANGALELKLETWLKSEEYKWAAFGKFQGNMTPQVVWGGMGAGTQNNAMSFMDLMSAQAARQLSLDLMPTPQRVKPND